MGDGYTNISAQNHEKINSNPDPNANCSANLIGCLS